MSWVWKWNCWVGMGMWSGRSIRRRRIKFKAFMKSLSFRL